MYKTAETVSPGHPDKIADLISDYVLTEALSNNKKSRVAVETFLTGTSYGGLVVVGGEISEIANIDDETINKIVKEALSKTIKTSFGKDKLNRALCCGRTYISYGQLDKALNLVWSNKITDVKTIIGILWYQKIVMGNQ